jgi:O-succinylbenzoic acid--CoA ligase
LNHHWSEEKLMDIKPVGAVATDPAEWLERACARTPQAPALFWGGGALDFAALGSRVRAIAARLAPYVERVPTLILAPESRLELALALYAGLYLGKRLLPLNSRLSWSEQRRLCTLAGPAALLAPQAGALGCLPVPVEVLAPPQGPVPAAMGRCDGTGLLIATSGSSGQPRLVWLMPRNLAASVAAARQRIPLGPGDCWLACLPLFHIGGLAIVLRALEAGAAVRLHEAFDPVRVWRDLRTTAVTHLSLVPALLHRLLAVAADAPPPSSLRTVLVGGAALDPGLARRAQGAGWPLCVTYGMSEAGSQVATLCGGRAGLEPGRVGRPLQGFEVMIGAPDPAGVGRIRLRGPAVMAGYGAPGVGLDNGWLETGDLGRLDAGGELHLLGRADQVLVSGGEKVHPEPVEALLRACPGVLDAGLTAVPDPVWGERLVALYTGDARTGRVDEHCREHLAGARRPRIFLRVDTLPLGPTGKLDRQALRRLVAYRLARSGPWVSEGAGPEARQENSGSS